MAPSLWCEEGEWPAVDPACGLCTGDGVAGVVVKFFAVFFSEGRRYSKGLGIYQP